jgi:hypothetical protein
MESSLLDIWKLSLGADCEAPRAKRKENKKNLLRVKQTYKTNKKT